MKRRLAHCIAGLLLAGPALAQTGLTALDDAMRGPRTQVLVLGSVHLGEATSFDPRSLATLLDRLAAFRPGIVTIEAIPGESCDLAARHPVVYGPDFCATTDAARAATGLDVPAAIAAIAARLSTWPSQPTAAQRRHLAALFLAANDGASACVQWLQLPDHERRAGDGLDDALVAQLQAIATRPNENIQIGARLAARLGLQRVYAVDDHSGDNMNVVDAKAFGREIEAAWKAGRGELDRIERREDALKQAGDWLPLYRFLNQPDNLRILADVNVGAAMRAPSRSRYPQMWVSGWEIRNLRMVANIHQTFREMPGARVLSIVGASHKPWFDDWLGQMQGVEIVDAEAVLK